MEDLYSFIDKYLTESFDVEKVLKDTSRGKVCRMRHKASHRRYICRRYNVAADSYLLLRDTRCEHLPRIYEAARTEDENGRIRSIVLEEYIQGDTLDMLLEQAPLTGKQVKNITLQICDGLYVLHSLGLVHRDIKPGNVIICGDHAVLIDFDAAALYNPDKSKDTKVLGTVGYAPPEQYGISRTDYRSDIYALGVLINEMITGKHPSQQLAPGRWGRIVQRCTQIQPRKRYNSVHELMEAL